MVINLSSLRQDIINKYNLLELAHDGWVYNPERHVRLDPGWHPHQFIVAAMISRGWVTSHRTYAWLMETQNPPGLAL
jgi:hypothetical protein